MARQPRSTQPRATQFATGLGALLVLIALVIGVPWLLLTLAGNPLPDHLPSLSEAGDALVARDDGQLFISALAVLAWGGWATFTLSVLVEIPAALRRRPSLRLPGLGRQQRVAAGLIAAIALMAPAPALATSTAAHAVTDAPHQTAVIATAFQGGGGSVPTDTSAATTTSPSTATQLTYVVARGDQLSDIAERFLGDPNRYPQIAALNGIGDADHIEATQQLRLPAGASDHGTRPHAAGTVLEQQHSPRPSHPASPPPDQKPDAPAPTASTPPTTPPSPTASAAPSPSSTPTTRPDTTPTPAGTTETAGSTSQPTTRADGVAEDDSALEQLLPIGAPLAGAGLLAALLLARLRRRRNRQQQHRPVGKRVPAPLSPKAETNLRVVAQPMSVDRLDHALRVLGAALVDRPADQMPDIVGAWLEGDTVHLLLTGPCPSPPTPWVGDQSSWSLPADATLPPADGQLAPLPALVTVGSRPGMHLLLDLERLGLLTITGDPQYGADLLRYLAAELACNAWSDHVDVTVAGFDAEQTAQLIALGGDRIDASPTIAAAIERVRRRAGQIIQSLDHLDAGDPFTGRVADIAGDTWMPYVLLAANPDNAEIAALESLDNDLAAAGRSAVAVVATSRDDVGRWPVSIDPSGRLSIAFLGMVNADATLTAAGLPQSELGSLAELLATARTGANHASGDPRTQTPDELWADVPAATESEDWAQGTDAAGAPLHEDVPANTLDSEADSNLESSDETALGDTAPAAASEGPSEPVEHRDNDAEEPNPMAEITPATQPVDRPAGEDAGHVPVVQALAQRPPSPRRSSSPARRRHTDPTLDADVRAWLEPDETRPRVAILGPVTVDAPGPVPAERVRFYAEIATYLASRGARGATADQFDEALWPGRQIDAASRRVAIARARRWLGETQDGEKWLPDMTTDRRYRLADGFLLDWHLFRRLRTRGETRGPAGVNDLRQALALVRGVPLAGADIAYSSTARNPYTWLVDSEIQPHHLTSAIVDTAHKLVELCLGGGDPAGARRAVEQAWLADGDHSSDIPYRDLLRVAATDGNTAELEQLLDDLMRVREAEVPEDLDRTTYGLLCELMPDRIRAGVR